MGKLYHIYENIWRDKKFLLSLCLSFLLLLFSLVVNYYAGQFATEKASNSVTDLILSNIPVFDLDGIFIYGPVIFWLLTTFYAFGFQIQTIKPTR